MAVAPLSRRPKAAFAALSVAFALLSISPAAHAATSIGSLDPAFGAGGRLTLSNRRQAMQFPPLVLPDGRFRLIEGVPGDGTALVGFLPDGSPDGGFGTGGVVTFAPGVHPRAMALDASGRIVLTGTTGTGATVDELILRRLPNGSADPSFGTSGRVTMDFLGTVDAGCGVAIDGTGRIVVAGDTVLPSTVSYRTALTAVRLLPDGTPDTAFAGDGSRIFKRNPHTYLCSSGETDVRPQADGSTVLAGRQTACTVIHLTKGGALDTTFSDGGIAAVESISANWGFSPACRMTTDAQGNIVLVSRSDHRVGSHRFNVGIVRLLPDGSRDATFARNGATQIDMFGGDDLPAGVLVDGAGGIVVSSRTSRLGRQPDAGLLRLLSDGTVDGSFGYGGRLATDLTEADSNDGVAGTATLPGGGLLLLGHVVSTDGTQIPVVAKYGPATLDTSPPTSQIGRPKDGATYGRLGLRVVRGTADDSLSMVRRVTIAVRALRTDGTCKWLRRDGAFVSRACDEPLWLRVSGTYLWHKRLPAILPFSRGTRIAHYNLYSRAVDLAANVETAFERGRNNDSFEIGS
jgi:uncharacterized delta-60 repeat protein